VSAHALLARTLQMVSHDAVAKNISVTLDKRAINDRLTGDPARFVDNRLGGVPSGFPAGLVCSAEWESGAKLEPFV
jgi:hypothetical protein